MDWALPEGAIKWRTRCLALVDSHTVRVISVNCVSRSNRAQIPADH